MSKKQQLKMASVKLAVAFEERIQNLMVARGEDETVKAAADLSILFNDNLDFILWALRKQGGISAEDPEFKIHNVPTADLPQTPEILTQ